MLGSSQRTGDHHQFHQHYYHQQLNHFAQPIFFHHHQQQLLKQEAFDEFGSATSSSFQVQAAAAAADQEAAAAYGSNRRLIEPTSVLDLWSPSPSSRGGCSKSASPPRSSAFVEESNSSEKSVEVSKFLNDHQQHHPQQQQQQVWGVVEDRDGEKPNRDKSLDEWLADLQQQKLVRRNQEEEEEDEEEEQHPASSSSCNKINDVHHHHPQQYGIEELESMLLSPSSSSAQACSSSLNHQLAKWLMSEDLGQQQQQQQASAVSSFGLVPKEDHEGFGDGGFYSASSSEFHGAPKIIQPFGGHFLRQQQQPQAYPAHQPSSGVGLEQFFATTPSPGFGEAFHQQSATTTPSFGHGGFGGIEEAVGWKRGRSPGILHQGDPFAEVHEENKKRMMMIQQQQQQQQQQLMNPLLLQFSNAFAVPLVAEAKPWGGSGAGRSSKLQRVHSNSELVGGDGIGISSSSCNRVIPSGFSTISTGLSPVSLNSSSSRNPSPNPTTATATTTALPSTISVPDEGGLGLMDQLLQLAQAIDVGGTQVAQSILARLNQHLFCHQQGKRIHRLAFYFKEALAARLNSSSSSANSDHHHQQQTAAAAASNSAAQLFNKIRAYTSFCEISPLLRFSYLTANEAILESIQGEAAAHIVDFDPRFGSQWASLLQDMAAPHKSNNYGASGQAQPVQFPRLRFTMVGPDLARLSFVVESLREFATSLHLLNPPQFNLLLCDQPGRLTPSMLGVTDGEALVFNFMFSLHRSLALPDGADAAVSAVMTASPRLVTVAEQEVDDCDGKFQRRFVETLQYYAFVLDSLGPDDGAGTLTVEREILSPDIANAVSEEGWGRTERHERLSTWKARMARAGFESVAASDVAKLQGECLIRRHLHGKNFEVVRDDDGAMLLGWQGKNLVAVSAWTPADSSSKNNIC